MGVASIMPDIGATLQSKVRSAATEGVRGILPPPWRSYGFGHGPDGAAPVTDGVLLFFRNFGQGAAGTGVRREDGSG